MAERPRDETPEMRRLRKKIDALDRRIVGLLNERADLGREVGRARGPVFWGPCQPLRGVRGALAGGAIRPRAGFPLAPGSL